MNNKTPYAEAVRELLALNDKGVITAEVLEETISKIEFETGLIDCTPIPKGRRRQARRASRLFKSVSAYFADL